MRSMALATFAALLSGGLVLALPAEAWTDLLSRAKYGHATPTTEARLQAEAVNTAYRADSTTRAHPGISSSEQWFWTKYGRYSNQEESRRIAELESTAYRGEPNIEAQDPGRQFREMMKSKYGRDPNSR